MSDFNIGALPELNLNTDSEPIVSDGQPVESPEESLLNPFLSGIPEADRDLVGKYVKDWDANVTKKFQAIHESYKPYKELGMEPDKLAEAVNIYRIIDQEPERVLEILQEMLKVENEEIVTPEIIQPVVPEYEGLPEPFVQKFSQMETALERFNNFIELQEQQRVEAEQFRELDTLLERMHTKHGDFDDEYVIAKLAAGMSPEDSISSYTKLVEKLTAPKSSPAPSLLGGAGGVPTGQVNPKEMTSAETRDFIARALAANNS